VSVIGSPSPNAISRAASDENLSSSMRPLPLLRPAWLPESAWPFPTFGLKIDNSTIAVSEAGQGPTLLFVHTGVWSFIWRDLMLHLVGDFRCICLDAPGTGQSSRLPGREISLAKSAHVISTVIQSLDLQDLTLVLHDLGGPCGIAGALKVADRIRGIAALNTFGWKPAGAFFRGMLALMGSAPMREFSVLTEFLSIISSSKFGAGRHMDKASRQVFRAGIDAQARRAFHYYMRDARNAGSLFETVERALVHTFNHLPLITIFGELNDPLGFQRHWKALFPDALQFVVKGGHHFPMCDDPEFVAAAIRSWHMQKVAPTFQHELRPPGSKEYKCS